MSSGSLQTYSLIISVAIRLSSIKQIYRQFIAQVCKAKKWGNPISLLQKLGFKLTKSI